MNRAVPANRLGVGDPCPFCGATGGVSETDDGTYICLVCGQPRVLVEGGVARAFGEKRWLLRSKALKLKRTAWTVAAGVTGAASLFFGTVVGLVQWSIGLPSGWLEFAVGLAAMPLLVALFAFSRASRAGKQSADALEKAQATVAQEVLRAGGPDVDATELSRKLRIPVTRAEELLAMAQVEKFLTEEPAPAPGPRVRVDPTAENPAADDAFDDQHVEPGRRTR